MTREEIIDGLKYEYQFVHNAMRDKIDAAIALIAADGKRLADCGPQKTPATLGRVMAQAKAAGREISKADKSVEQIRIADLEQEVERLRKIFAHQPTLAKIGFAIHLEYDEDVDLNEVYNAIESAIYQTQ